MGITSRPISLPDATLVASLRHFTWLQEQRAKGITSYNKNDEERMMSFDKLSLTAQKELADKVTAIYAAIQEANRTAPPTEPAAATAAAA